MDWQGGNLTGYGDTLSVGPTEQITFMISTSARRFEASIVRLVHGDTSPAGPGLVEIDVPSTVDGSYPGRLQPTAIGSSVIVETRGWGAPESFTLQAWVMPTRPVAGREQSLLASRDPDGGAGYALLLDAVGRVCLQLSDGTQTVGLAAVEPTEEREWLFVAATFDSKEQIAALTTRALSSWRSDQLERHARLTGLSGGVRPGRGTPLRIGTGFDGKIDSPCLIGRALAAQEIEELAHTGSPEALAGGTFFAAWEFGGDQASTVILDRGPEKMHGRAVNMPARAVTGRAWSGEETDFRRRPDEYRAIHFHADDLEDAAWEPSVEWRVPEELSSGVYALRTKADGLEDRIPFVVRPRPGSSVARVAFLLPTMTYLAYANERMGDPMQPNSPPGWPSVLDPLDRFLSAHPEFGKSLYDIHDDGSGVRYSSFLRPIPSLRPNYRFRFLDAPRHFGADLYVTAWLENIGVAYDAITDHDLHEGRTPLSAYSVVLTGGHPEYMSASMLSELEAWVAAGGRLMYLGGNGCYWVTSVHPERPHVIEVRRGHAGSRAWESEPGELHHSTTGELGGLWRQRGKLPNRLLGVGFGAEGVDVGSPAYRRSADSYEEGVAWIFDGVDAECFGVGGLVLGGAAGDEVDRADRALGTPSQTVVLASATGFGSAYEITSEDDVRWRGNRSRGEVRADMTLTVNPHGGAVFSVGSISWSGALSWNGYTNDVARISENVLRRFLAD